MKDEEYLLPGPAWAWCVATIIVTTSICLFILKVQNAI